jgi:hypothetical protein
LAGCAPAEPAAASPAADRISGPRQQDNRISANGELSLLFLSQGGGPLQADLSHRTPSENPPIPEQICLPARPSFRPARPAKPRESPLRATEQPISKAFPSPSNPTTRPRNTPKSAWDGSVCPRSQTVLLVHSIRLHPSIRHPAATTVHPHRTAPNSANGRTANGAANGNGPTGRTGRTANGTS